MAELTRRDALTMAAGLGLTACGSGDGASAAAAPSPVAVVPAPTAPPQPTPPAPPAPAAPTTSLDMLARARARRFGSAVAWSEPDADRGAFANPSYAALLEADCGVLVAENEMKWQAIRPSATSFDFARFDAIVAYAETRKMAVRGHNLLWHQPKWMPRWAETHDYGASPVAEAERLLVDHVRTVCRRYSTGIGSYDVVNEAVDPANAGLYQTALSRALGGAEATIDLAFRTARAEAPHAELVYNDYMSWEPGNAQHRAGVLKLLEGFRARGVPVDALGLQSHLVTQGTDAASNVGTLQAEWRRFLDAVVAMGYKLLITELDVRDNDLPADIAVRDRAAADFTRGYLDVTLGYPQLGDVLVWGLCDRYSWIEGFEPRRDGQLRRPCPYDREFKAKPMRTAIAEALVAAPARA